MLLFCFDRNCFFDSFYQHPFEILIIQYNRKTLHVGVGLRTNVDHALVTHFENDIAVIKLKNASSLQCKRESIWPACLPNKENDYAGWIRTIASGWGRVEGDESVNLSVSRPLMKTSLPIVTGQQCANNVRLDPSYLDEKIFLFQVGDDGYS